MLEIKSIDFFIVGGYELSSDLWLNVKTFLDFGLTLYMDNFGRIFLNNPGAFYLFIGQAII